MEQKTFRTVILAISLVFILTALVSPVRAADAPRMTKEELKGMLGSSDLVIIDVRAGRDWTSSAFKIQGAVREDPYNVPSWAGKCALSRTLVLYCA
ncbi:hypothetical protein SAMN02746041_01261 [Desulfacinum hydrothermale DSM 13146]|uniref:Rhodanese-like domain-containing protein n=1 Tax=Desulfacinum hydrothermale DSM 13146 TaxID=1121390 RepID=A0A1W1XCC0_9BACT|nr:hypothetical protein SAMN02746041_01261 [Desulfacinum hydrothermale DSM 13146]